MEVDVFADTLSPDTSPHNIIIMQDSASSLQVIRKRLDPDEVYPSNMRYDATCNCIQTTYDGGTTWVDTPYDDPRTSPVFARPPRGTGGVSCDAAANMVQWIHDFIDMVEEVLFVGGLVISAVNGLLKLFDVLSGGWAILIDAIITAAGYTFDVGYSGLLLAFTSTTYDDLLCIFACGLAPMGLSITAN